MNGETRSSAGTWALAAALLLLHALLVLRSSRALECTVDELSYFNAGRVLLEHGWAHEQTLKQGPIPLAANQLFAGEFPPGGYQRLGEQDGLLRRGRLGTLPFALLAAALVFLWARRAFGDGGGLFALLLHALNPVLIGYGATLLVDVPLAAFVLLALYCLWRYLESGGNAFVLGSGAALGLALATKYSALLVAPTIALGAATAAWVRAERRLTSRAVAAALVLLLLGTSALLALHAGYGFHGGLADPAADERASALLAAVLRVPLLGQLAGLLPDHFLRGVDFQLATSAEVWEIFLNGRFASGHPDYYLWTVLCKTPEPVLLLAALFLVWRLPALLRASAEWRAAATVLALLPAMLVVFTYMSLCTSMQLGVRYVLPLYPLGFVLLGSLAGAGSLLRAPRAARLVLLGLLGVLLGADLVRNGPDLIAYYNASSGGAASAYRRFRDTNGDFGQHDRGGLAELRALAPGPCESLCTNSGARFGRLALSGGHVRARDPDDRSRPRFDWLTAGEPLAHVGASWWLFEATPEGLEARLEANDDPELRQALALAYLGADRPEDADRHLLALDERHASALRLLRSLDAEQEPLKVIALWLEFGRPDRAVALLERRPELATSRLGIAARIFLLEERRDRAGVEALLDELPAGPWDLEILHVVDRLEPGDSIGLVALYDRVMGRVSGSTWFSSWERMSSARELRERMERLRAFQALLE